MLCKQRDIATFLRSEMISAGLEPDETVPEGNAGAKLARSYNAIVDDNEGDSKLRKILTVMCGICF